MRKLMGFASTGLLLCQMVPTCAAEVRTLGDGKLACTSIQDWTDIMSLERQNGAAVAALADKLNAGECTRWRAGAQVRVEQRETGKLANGDAIRLACAKPMDHDEAKCSWVIDDVTLGRPR